MRQELTVKVSHPTTNTGFHEVGIIGQSPGNRGIWGNYRFEFNKDIEACDYWIIYESTPKKERAQVPPGHVIFIPGEEVVMRAYSLDYLEQFDAIITSRSDIEGSRVIKSHFMTAWFVKRTYDDLKREPVLQKDKDLSIVVSNKTRLGGRRLAFALEMAEHFKDRIDVFGSGINYVDDKYDALAPYRYSIALENGTSDDYWTEKIADCYLCQTMPIYYGCPNITDYFDAESLISIDVDDPEASIRVIEEALAENVYEKSLPGILGSRAKVLDELQFFPWLTSLLDANQGLGDRTSGRRIAAVTPISEDDCPKRGNTLSQHGGATRWRQERTLAT